VPEKVDCLARDRGIEQQLRMTDRQRDMCRRAGQLGLVDRNRAVVPRRQIPDESAKTEAPRPGDDAKFRRLGPMRSVTVGSQCGCR
jgi:hypothetical protein